jgi:hypothetical protein
MCTRPGQESHEGREVAGITYYQFLDLAANGRIFHVFLESGGIALCLLENTLHHRILHDVQDLAIISNSLTPARN